MIAILHIGRGLPLHGFPVVFQLMEYILFTLRIIGEDSREKPVGWAMLSLGENYRAVRYLPEGTE